MTIKEIYELFEMRLDLECKLKNKKRIQVNPGLALHLMTLVQRDIVDKLNLITAKTTLSVSAQTAHTHVALPANFGKIKQVKIGEVRLNEITAYNLSEQAGTPTQFLIEVTSVGPCIMLDPYPSDTVVLNLLYIVDTLLYHPSESSSTWAITGAVAESLSGYLVIKDRYIDLLITGMLGHFFKDKLEEYMYKRTQEVGNQADTSFTLSTNDAEDLWVR